MRFYVAKRRTTALTPVRSKITYHKYVGFCFGRALPCSSSVWRHKTFVFKPCQRPTNCRKSLLSVLAGTKNSCRSFARLSACCVRASTQAGKRTLIQGILISGMCLFRVRAARRREYECRAFVAHKLLLLQPQQVVVVRLGSLCSSSHTTKTSLSSLICKH